MRTIALLVLLAILVGCEKQESGGGGGGGGGSGSRSQEVKVKEPRPEKKILARDEFRKRVIGKTEAEVLKAVGKPDNTIEITGHRTWTYRGATRDPITDKVDFAASVIFQNGIVDRVNF